jgi:hypothetical protein
LLGTERLSATCDDTPRGAEHMMRVVRGAVHSRARKRGHVGDVVVDERSGSAPRHEGHPAQVILGSRGRPAVSRIAGRGSRPRIAKVLASDAAVVDVPLEIRPLRAENIMQIALEEPAETRGEDAERHELEILPKRIEEFLMGGALPSLSSRRVEAHERRRVVRPRPYRRLRDDEEAGDVVVGEPPGERHRVVRDLREVRHGRLGGELDVDDAKRDSGISGLKANNRAIRPHFLLCGADA